MDQILFDKGAQRSFMTQQLAHDLHVQSYRHQQICISAFGEKELQLTTISIQNKGSGEVPVYWYW